MVGCILKVLYVAETYEAIGMDVHVYYCFQIMLLDPFVMAFVDMPFLSLCAKITPTRIEGTAFALMMGLRNFQTSVL